MTRDGDLRNIFRQRLPLVHWVTIETGLLGRGVPDSEFCHAGATGWVEFKRTDAWWVALAPEQVAWLVRRARAGGRAFIAVRRHRGASPRLPACDELWLLRGQFAREVKDLGLRCPPEAVLGRWAGGPASWAWAEVLGLLTA